MNLQALSSKFATCLSVVFFPLQDVKLLLYLSIMCLLVPPISGFYMPRSSACSVLLGVLRSFPLGLIIETFQQIAVVASRK